MRSREVSRARDTQHCAVKIPFSLQTSAEVEGVKKELTNIHSTEEEKRSGGDGRCWLSAWWALGTPVIGYLD